MNKFIYVFTEESYKNLINYGFSYIGACNLGKKVYIFENNIKSLTFNEEDKKCMLFTDKMYF